MNLLVDVVFTAQDSTPEAFDAFLDRVLDELAKIGVEADVTASLAKYEASFEMAVSSADLDQFSAAVASLRAALHAADCATAGWPAGCVVRCVQPHVDAELSTCS